MHYHLKPPKTAQEQLSLRCEKKKSIAPFAEGIGSKRSLKKCTIIREATCQRGFRA